MESFRRTKLAFSNTNRDFSLELVATLNFPVLSQLGISRGGDASEAFGEEICLCPRFVGWLFPRVRLHRTAIVVTRKVLIHALLFSNSRWLPTVGRCRWTSIVTLRRLISILLLKGWRCCLFRGLHRRASVVTRNLWIRVVHGGSPA